MQLRPRDYQIEALSAIKKGLQENNRITVVMACGTGKTMVSLWAAEQSKARNIVIFMPSLALIKQTIERWIEQTNWKHYDVMAVCSDQTLDDELSIDQSECDFIVTTEKDRIESFLYHSEAQTRIIFCTYQSSHLLHGFTEFDLGIFDEAHKTAHKSELAFRYALKDENVYIMHRIFMTATPKHYSYTNPTEYNKKRIEYSMDNEEIYGKIVYRLDFTEAIKRNIICDYKVIISVINNDMIKNELSSNKYIQNDNKQLNLMMLAHAISLKQSFDNFPIKRCITFHRTIKESREFIKAAVTTFEDKRAFGELMRGDVRKQLQHINGSMNSEVRADIINQFLVSKKAIISNARCLSEGVDIPEIDLVGFFSPKKSKVDIIQAAGRVMRKCDGKEYGYILLPIYIESHQKLDDILDTNEYRYIFSILNSLREYDTTLNNELSTITGPGREQLVKYGKNKIEFISCNIDQDVLNKSIQVRIAESFRDEWEAKFEKLKEYKERTGGFVFKNTRNPSKEEFALRHWVIWQRSYFKAGTLETYKLEKLQSIGFVFDAENNRWNKDFELLKEEVNINGLRGFQSSNKKAADWFQYQRSKIANNTLEADKKKLIVDLCKSIEGGEDYLTAYKCVNKVFEKNYKKLLDYYNKHGHCNIPEREDPYLYKWRYNRSINKSKIKQEHIDKLNAVGFKWREEKTNTWQDRFEELKEYKEKNGTFSFYNKEHNRLASWCVRQRAKYKANQLNNKQEQLLNSIGFLHDAYGRKLTKRKA